MCPTGSVRKTEACLCGSGFQGFNKGSEGWLTHPRQIRGREEQERSTWDLSQQHPCGWALKAHPETAGVPRGQWLTEVRCAGQHGWLSRACQEQQSSLLFQRVWTMMEAPLCLVCKGLSLEEWLRITGDECSGEWSSLLFCVKHRLHKGAVVVVVKNWQQTTSASPVQRSKCWAGGYVNFKF